MLLLPSLSLVVKNARATAVGSRSARLPLPISFLLRTTGAGTRMRSQEKTETVTCTAFPSYVPLRRRGTDYAGGSIHHPPMHPSHPSGRDPHTQSVQPLSVCSQPRHSVDLVACTSLLDLTHTTQGVVRWREESTRHPSTHGALVVDTRNEKVRTSVVAVRRMGGRTNHGHSFGPGACTAPGIDDG